MASVPDGSVPAGRRKWCPMPYVITRSCCNDASCVSVCPVNCIHPTPDEPDFGTSEMLYIDPDACIDCGACVPECPVEAIVADVDLTEETEPYAELNARYFLDPAHRDYPGAQYDASRPAITVTETGPLRVAVVGSGPAGCYAAEELLGRRGIDVEVHLFERLPVPWGLVRFGVAPDHQDTKSVVHQFRRTANRSALTFHLNVEVGTHVSHDELLQHHHAVIYTVGANQDRKLGIPGETLPGSHSATEFVAWYNGHPDFADLAFDLSAERAVVVGNGNVALDVARILASDIDHLARTDIADHALEALAASAIRAVVILGRRGPDQAAFTTPELIALGQRPDFAVRVDVDGASAEPDPIDIAGFKAQILRELAARPPAATDRTVTLRFLRSPVEILGSDRVSALRTMRNELIPGPDGSVAVRPTGATEDIPCGLVLRSIGYRGAAVPDVPFDDARGTIPNQAGRVLASPHGEPLTGVYTAGWIKRGPSGVIGTNKKCAGDTVQTLIDDYIAGRLAAPPASVEELTALLESRQPRALDYSDWLAVDRHELSAGKEHDRPRVKVVDVEDILALASRTKTT